MPGKNVERAYGECDDKKSKRRGRENVDISQERRRRREKESWGRKDGMERDELMGGCEHTVSCGTLCMTAFLSLCLCVGVSEFVFVPV